jgi:hypothetical protein
MLHRGPQLSGDLNARFDLLMSEYEQIKRKKVNPERQKFIKLIQSFRENVDTQYDHQAALGICAYGLIKIDGSFGLFTVPKKKSHYQFFGSELGELLQKALSIHYSNPLDDQQAFIYLTALYHHLKKYPRSLDGTFGESKESLGLIKDIEKQIKILLEQLAAKRPTYHALLQNFTEIEETYKNFGGSDVSRNKYILFTQLLNTDLTDRYQFEAKDNLEWTDPYAIRYAAMLYVFEEIEADYQYLSPAGGYLSKGSALYKACKQALNININAKEIPEALKCHYYVALLSYVVRTLPQPHELEKWEKKGLIDPITFFVKLRNALAEKSADLMRITKPGCMTLSYMDFAISYAASYGVSIAIGAIATEMSLRGAALTCATVLRPEAALLITLLACATKSLVSTKATGVVKTLLITTVSQPILITMNSAINFGEFCYGLFVAYKNAKSMEVIDNDDFMKALLSLPDTVWTPALKEKMKYVAAYGREKLSIEMEATKEQETIQENEKVLKIS